MATNNTNEIMRELIDASAETYTDKYGEERIGVRRECFMSVLGRLEEEKKALGTTTSIVSLEWAEFYLYGLIGTLFVLNLIDLDRYNRERRDISAIAITRKQEL